MPGLHPHRVDLRMFRGTDDTFEFVALDGTGATALDATGWALSWMVKQRVTQRDGAAAIAKTSAAGVTVSGAFHSDAARNEQRVIVALADSDTDALRPGTYRHELKRMDEGFETVIAYGEFELVRGIHHA